jgi:hypothetical protein
MEHEHEEHGHEQHEEHGEVANTLTEKVEEVSHAGHDHAGETVWDTIIEITFGIEHMVAEFFWNIVFALGVYAFAKARTLRKIHKYVDSKHGVEHEEY